jgi:hypothetical protein
MMHWMFHTRNQQDSYAHWERKTWEKHPKALNTGFRVLYFQKRD